MPVYTCPEATRHFGKSSRYRRESIFVFGENRRDSEIDFRDRTCSTMSTLREYDNRSLRDRHQLASRRRQVQFAQRSRNGNPSVAGHRDEQGCSDESENDEATGYDNRPYRVCRCWLTMIRRSPTRGLSSVFRGDRRALTMI